MLSFSEIDLKKPFWKYLERFSSVGKKVCFVYIAMQNKVFEGWFLKHLMATLKEIFDLWACEITGTFFIGKSCHQRWINSFEDP